MGWPNRHAGNCRLRAVVPAKAYSLTRRTRLDGTARRGRHLWTDIQAVELAIDGRPAHAVSDVGPPSDVYVFEVNRQPRLCLTKTLSSPAAEPGEVVLVTIHYDNVGDSAIDNLRIVDNLTTRLEFVADSDFSSHRALFLGD